MTTPPDFTTYTRDHWTCLLDLERFAVANEGMIGRVTEAELEAIQKLEHDGIIEPWSHTLLPIKLTDRGWAVAHAIRRARAEKASRETWPELARRAAATFEEVWAAKEAEGYQYGPDALEGVRFGWDLAHGGASSKVAIAGLE